MSEPVNLPSFLCIGAQKAGTTWLYRNLKQNQSIWMGYFKEYHFFNSVHEPRDRAWTSNQIRSMLLSHIRMETKPDAKQTDFSEVERYAKLGNAAFMFTDDWYRLIFSDPKSAGKITGDITPAYSSMPRSGVEHALRMLGGVPVIYIVRDPVSRGLSYLKMRVKLKKLDLHEVDWRAEARSWTALSRGDYRTNIPVWESVWPADKIMYIPFGRIKTEPANVMAEVEDFIGAPHSSYRNLDDKVNKGADITIPGEAIEEMRAAMAGQTEFLAERFGQSFVDRII